METIVLNEGDKAPIFSLPDAYEKEVSLADFQGKWVVLYFYPKDSTPGCTVEAIDFTASIDKLRALGAEVIGISHDSCKSHVNFIEKNGLKVILLSDSSKKVSSLYGVYKQKKINLFGIERTTFLIAPNMVIRKIWRKVDVINHVEDVMKTLLQYL